MDTLLERTTEVAYGFLESVPHELIPFPIFKFTDGIILAAENPYLFRQMLSLEKDEALRPSAIFIFKKERDKLSKNELDEVENKLQKSSIAGLKYGSEFNLDGYRLCLESCETWYKKCAEGMLHRKCQPFFTVVPFFDSFNFHVVREAASWIHTASIEDILIEHSSQTLEYQGIGINFESVFDQARFNAMLCGDEFSMHSLSLQKDRMH